ncbi:hypothetical protein DSM107010_30550 [Chroococcidiopsis cubana SAG 39.79]|uniref:ABC transporter domain-containing protein n=1 Tax=Chroococcidiopsis cubana SAG 39.79 TaxID=388085 RepID=A0AB37UJK8_9CYAN|nr:MULTISPECIES: hypothetical protein [Chroococcidiopsis]RUT11568.1 hypothetical protein DSM107010_30550 [Chroococcidiopsis cubana SAG 39.79]URD52849.1 hypothetical protein M5J74_12805 [Chroococcidiopsis sp. CCNUC1]
MSGSELNPLSSFSVPLQAQDARILLLDEPTTYLDIRYQLELLELLKQLN